MKKIASIAAMAVMAVFLTGCFESDEQKAIKAAIMEDYFDRDNGYEVSSVEIINESTKVDSGYTITERGFKATLEATGDAVLVLSRFNGEALLVTDVPEEFQTAEAAGLYMHATNGVDVEEDIRITSKKTWSRSLEERSELAESGKKIIKLGSGDEKDFTANLKSRMAEIDSKEQELKGIMEAADEEKYSSDRRDAYWAEMNKLVEERTRIEREIAKINKKVESDVNEEFNKELNPHYAQKEERLSAANKMPWGSAERRQMRSEAYDTYNKIKSELNDKYVALMEEKKTKTTPEMDEVKAKIKALEDAYEAKDEALRAKRNEAQEELYKLQAEKIDAEEWIRRVGDFKA